jgi:hypothetical protein
MPINIRSIDEIKAKWTRVTPARSEDYRLGVTTPKKDWKTGASAGKENFKAAMQKVIAEDRQNKGVLKSSTDFWKQKALALGTNRFSEGVAVAGDDYGRGFGPYRDVIAGLTLPPRYPKGDSRNLERVKVIADALHKKKIG